MNIKSAAESSKADDAMTCQLAVAAALGEVSEAPRFTYVFECVGAREECRDEYVRLFEERRALVLESGAIRDQERYDELTELMAPMTEVKWRDTFHNTVTNVGKADLLDKYFAGSAYTAAFYLGLISSVSYTTGPAATDTMSSHGGWTEAGPTNAPNYGAATRPAISWSAASGAGTVTKQSSAAVSFVFSASGTVKGGFITTNNSKDGTTGILYSAGTFTGGDKTVGNTDTVNVTVSVSQT